MSKKKKSNDKKEIPKKLKEFVVVSAKLDNYRYFDARTNKPICYKKVDDSGEMVLQEIEELKVRIDSNNKKDIDYFSPNNVGIMLSIASKSLNRSQLILENDIVPRLSKDIEESGKIRIENNSRIIYDYIEEMQSSIVFGYTALESFCNLSIPEDYQFKEKNNKGIMEVFDKEAIERWTPLSKKISIILPEIYETIPITSKNIWFKFKEFEKIRNEIIHQKSVTSVVLYKSYFQKNIVDLCEIPNEIIKFFFDEKKKNQNTNMLWPWMINVKNELPVSFDFNSNNFKVIGNIHDGKK